MLQAEGRARGHPSFCCCSCVLEKEDIPPALEIAWEHSGLESSSLSLCRAGSRWGFCGSSHQHRPLHPQRLQTLQLKGPPQSAWQGKGPSARVSCPEGSRGPGRAESRRLLALVLAKERARGRLWAQACAPSLQGPRRRGRRVCAWPRGRQGRPGRNGQRPRRDLRPSRPGAV